MSNCAPIRTFVVVSLFTPEPDEWTALWPNRLERERLQRDCAKGAVVLAKFQLQAEVPGLVEQEWIGGTGWGPAILHIDDNPLRAIVTEAYSGRMHMGDLYGDLKMTDDEVLSWWEFFAAPFSVQLDDPLARLLS